MGIFDRVKRAAGVALEVSSGDLDIGISQNVPPVEPGPNAWPLEEIARLAARPEPRDARAIVQSTGGVGDPDHGSRAVVDLTSITLILRPRLADGTLGPRSEHTALVPRDATLLLTPGTEIPVLMDLATGRLERIDKRAMVEELRPRFAEAREADDRARKRGLGFIVSELKEAVADLRAGEPAPVTVEGVSADQWLLARTALSKRPVRDSLRDRVVAAYGVPAGRWEAVDAEWSARARSDPALGARLAEIA